MQAAAGAHGFKAWGNLDVAYVTGKQYPVSSGLFRRVPTKLSSIISPMDKVVVVGAVAGGYTRIWDKRGVHKAEQQSGFNLYASSHYVCFLMASLMLIWF